MNSPKSIKLTTLLFLIFFLSTILTTTTSAFKINKNTVELLNSGLKALVSIKRILNTIKSVNELTGQAFPQLANNPKMKLVNKLFGVGPIKGHHLGETVSGTMQAKRNPSVGLIKIGEKPPPGLFPETLPYTISGVSQSALNPDQQLLSNSPSTLTPILSTSDLFSKLAAASANNGNSNSRPPGGSGSTSQLISHFSPNDLKTSGTINQPTRMYPYSSFTHSGNNNVYNDGDGSFEGTYETFQNN